MNAYTSMPSWLAEGITHAPFALWPLLLLWGWAIWSGDTVFENNRVHRTAVVNRDGALSTKQEKRVQATRTLTASQLAAFRVWSIAGGLVVAEVLCQLLKRLIRQPRPGRLVCPRVVLTDNVPRCHA
jgi:hypothetical protein